MPTKPTEPQVRIADLIAPSTKPERDFVLLVVKVPRELNAKVAMIAKSTKSHKALAVQALLNEGVMAYELATGKPKRGRPRTKK